MKNYIAKNRRQELVLLIADYLTDWIDDDTAVLEIEESISIIGSYGISYDNPCDELVINAIRHFDDIINFWNKSAIPTVLEEIGFTNEELKDIKYRMGLGGAGSGGDDE